MTISVGEDDVRGVLLGDGSWRAVKPGSLRFDDWQVCGVDGMPEAQGVGGVEFTTQDGETYSTTVAEVIAWRVER